VQSVEVKILDGRGEEAWSGNTDDHGRVQVELEEYKVDGDEMTSLSPYTVVVMKKKEEVYLDANKAITIKVR
jgi:hypothetical protein